MYKIGLTGGIGCGKSTVSDLFKKHSTPIIDADEIAHALVMPGQKALSQISHCFGPNCITTDGHLNRAGLREIIFNDADKKLQLEGIMHPLVYAEIDRQLNRLTSPYCIISIPLLIETKMQSLVDHILVIDCPMEIQINRVKLRNGLNDTQVMAMINSQVSRTERLAHADSIIDNTRDIIFLSQQVSNLHDQFINQTK
ncbi:MAG: dephospho-CoA kinase [Thiotrichaceae bacterium]|nr:dephospho-CoA kinase [Thiotrichaceae bacterium]